jgi:hypothetical protein
MKVEASVDFTDADNWSVNVYFSNSVCDSPDPGAPSKAKIILSKASGLWTGKAMLYSPRWEAPGATVTCATSAGGANAIAMYTDFVGNDTSTKAALYLIPATNNNLSSISSFGLPNFCTNFASSCGGAGQPANNAALSGYANNWCTTGVGTSPTWGNDCSSNAAVQAASYSNSSLWMTPSVLETYSFSLPISL